jgi:hypothetical protein
MTILNNRSIIGSNLLPVIARVDGISIDEIGGALPVNDGPHIHIHEGHTGVVSYKTDDASPLSDNGTLNFLIQTGSRAVHLVIRMAFGGDCELEIYEGTTFTNGTAMQVIAKNRYKVLPPGFATVIRDVTVSAAGTLLFNFFFPGGSGGNAQGVSETTRDEWILAPNTNYLVRGTNRAGTNQPAAIAIEWYEEEAV